MILKRGSIYHLRLMFNKRLYQRSLHTANKAEALKLEAAFRMSLVNGDFGITGGTNAPTLSEFEQRLLPHLKANVAPRTYGFYKENLKTLERSPLANVRLHRIDPSEIE